MNAMIMPTLTETEEAFACIICALLNVAIIALFGWDALKSRFIFSVFYTAILLALGYMTGVDVYSDDPPWKEQHQQAVVVTETIRRLKTNKSSRVERKHPAMLLALLYGIATISLGVPGSFLAKNVIDCSTTTYYRTADVTNIARLPKDVQKWAMRKSNTAGTPAKSFIYLPGTKTTIFSDKGIRSVSSSRPKPVAIHHFSANEFVLSNSKQTCFATTRFTIAGLFGGCFKCNTIGCTDGVQVKFAKCRSTKPQHLLAGSNGTIWYKESFNDSNGFNVVQWIIYSLDPSTMAETVHNEHVHDDAVYVPMLAFFFLSVLPIAIVSIYLWNKRHVPTMSVVNFLARFILFTGAMFLSVKNSLSPLGVVTFFSFPTSGILMSSMLMVHKAPMRRGLGIALLAYLSSFWIIVLNALILYPDFARSIWFSIVFVWTIVALTVVVLTQVFVEGRDRMLTLINMSAIALNYWFALGFVSLLLIAVLCCWLISHRLHFGTYLKSCVWPQHTQTTFRKMPRTQVDSREEDGMD